jgi:uncharacterized protein YjbI with pentapeptide repeats
MIRPIDSGPEFPIKCEMKALWLQGTYLGGVSFLSSDMSTSNFADSDLRHSTFTAMILSFSNLRRATLDWATLRVCQLKGADVTGANLDGTNLSFSFLPHVSGLSQDQLDKTGTGNRGLELPPGLKVPDNWYRQLSISDDER